MPSRETTDKLRGRRTTSSSSSRRPRTSASRERAGRASDHPSSSPPRAATPSIGAPGSDASFLQKRPASAAAAASVVQVKPGRGALTHSPVPLPKTAGVSRDLIVACPIDSQTGEVLKDAVMSVGCRLSDDAEDRFVSILTVNVIDGLLQAHAPPRRVATVVRIEAPGFTAKSSRVTAESGFDLGNVALTPTPCTLRGSIAELLTRYPVTDSLVTFTGGDSPTDADTNEDGRFEVTIIPGQYQLGLESSKCQPLARPVVIPRHEPVLDLGLVLAKHTPFQVAVTAKKWQGAVRPDPQRLPVPSVVDFKGRFTRYTVELDASAGMAVLDVHPMDSYTVALRIPNYQDVTVRMRKPLESLALDCRTLQLVTLPVRFRLVEGKYGTPPRETLRVRATGELSDLDAVSDEAGGFDLQLPNCLMTVTMTHDSYDDKTVEWSPPPSFFDDAGVTDSSVMSTEASLDASLRRLPSQGAPGRSMSASYSPPASPTRSSTRRFRPISVKVWYSLVRASFVVRADERSVTDSTVTLTDREPVPGWDPVVVSTQACKNGGKGAAKLYPGDYTAHVEAPGCETRDVEFTVPPADEGKPFDLVDLSLRAFRRRCQIVALTEDRTPLPDVDVTVRNVHGDMRLRTDEAGAVSCELLGNCSVTLRWQDEVAEPPIEPATADGAVVITAVVKTGGFHDVDYIPNGPMLMPVLDAKYGHPVSGAKVTFSDGFDSPTVTTGADGVAQATVPLWSQHITVSRKNFKDAKRVTQWDAGAAAVGYRRLDSLKLTHEPVKIKGRVLGDGKVPVPGATVTLTDEKAVPGWDPVVLTPDAADGGAYAAEVYPGPYRVAVKAPGCEGVAYELNLQQESDWNVPEVIAVRLRRRDVQLRVMTEGNAAGVAGAAVAVKTLLGTADHVTDAHGCARVELAGPTTVVAEHAEHGRVEHTPSAPTSNARGVLVVTFGDASKNEFGPEVAKAPTGAVAVEVEDFKPKEGLAGATVTVRDGTKSTLTARTSKAGTAEVQDVTMWGCTVTVSCERYDTQEFALPVTAEMLRTGRIAMERVVLRRTLVKLTGMVSVRNRAVPTATLTLCTEPEDDWSKEVAVSESDRGEYIATDLYPGDFVLRVASPGCLMFERRLSVEQNSRFPISMEYCVRPTQAIVVDAYSGKPLPNARLDIRTAVGTSQVTCNGLGRAAFKSVGVTSVEASLDDYDTRTLEPEMTSNAKCVLQFSLKSLAATRFCKTSVGSQYAPTLPDANQMAFELDKDATKAHGKVHDPSIVEGVAYFIAPESMPLQRLARLAGHKALVGVQPASCAGCATRFIAVKRPDGLFALVLEAEPDLALDGGDDSDNAVPQLRSTEPKRRSQWVRILRDAERGTIRIENRATGKALSATGAVKDGAAWKIPDTESSHQDFILSEADSAVTDGAVVALVPRHAPKQRLGVHTRGGLAASDAAGSPNLVQEFIVRKNGTGWTLEEASSAAPANGDEEDAVKRLLTVGRVPGNRLCSAPASEASAKRQVFDLLTTDDGFTMLQSRASGQFVSCARSGRAARGVVLARGRRARWQQFGVVPTTADEREGTTVVLEPASGASGRCMTARPIAAASKAIVTFADNDSPRTEFRRVPAGQGHWRLVPQADDDLALTAGDDGAFTLEPLDESKKAQLFGFERIDDDGPLVRVVTADRKRRVCVAPRLSPEHGAVVVISPRHAPNMRLDVEGRNSDNGAVMRLWDAKDDPTDGAAQRFQVIRHQDGTITFLPQSAGYRKSIGNGGGGNRPVQLADVADQLDQKWRQEPTDDGFFLLRNAVTNCVIDIDSGSSDSGARVVTSDAHGGPSQQFSIETVLSPPELQHPRPADGAIVEIAPRSAPELRVDVAQANTANGARLHLWEPNGTPAQRFKVSTRPDGSIAFLTETTGFGSCIDHARAPNHHPVHQWQCLDQQHADAANQKWSLEPSDNGYFYIFSAGPGCVLDVADNCHQQGDKIVTNQPHGDHNQQFRFIVAGTAGDAPPAAAAADDTDDGLSELVVDAGSASGGADDKSDQFRAVPVTPGTAVPTAATATDDASAAKATTDDAAPAADVADSRGKPLPSPGDLCMLAPRGQPHCRVRIGNQDGTPRAEIVSAHDGATVFQALQPAGVSTWELAPQTRVDGKPVGETRLEAGDDGKPATVAPASDRAVAHTLGLSPLPDGSVRIEAPAGGVLDGSSGVGGVLVTSPDPGDDATCPAFELLPAPQLDSTTGTAAPAAMPAPAAANDDQPAGNVTGNADDGAAAPSPAAAAVASPLPAVLTDDGCVFVVPVLARDKRVGVNTASGTVCVESAAGDVLGHRFRLSAIADAKIAASAKPMDGKPSASADADNKPAAPATSGSDGASASDAKQEERRFELAVAVVSAEDLPDVDTFTAADPFVSASWGGQTSKTTTKNDNKAPVWDETLRLGNAILGSGPLTVELYDEDTASNKLIGRATVDVSGLSPDDESAMQLALDSEDGFKAKLNVKLQPVLLPSTPPATDADDSKKNDDGVADDAKSASSDDKKRSDPALPSKSLPWYIEPATRPGQRLTATKLCKGNTKAPVGLQVRGPRPAKCDAAQRFDLWDLGDGTMAIVLSGGRLLGLDKGGDSVSAGRDPAAARGNASDVPAAARFEVHRAHTDGELEADGMYSLTPAEAPDQRVRVVPSGEVKVSQARGVRGERFKAIPRPQGTWAFEPAQRPKRCLSLDTSTPDASFTLPRSNETDRKQRLRVMPGEEPHTRVILPDREGAYVDPFDALAAAAVVADAQTNDASDPPAAAEDPSTTAQPGVKCTPAEPVRCAPEASDLKVRRADDDVESGGTYTIAPKDKPDLRFTARGDEVVAEPARTNDPSQQFVMTERDPGKWQVRPKEQPDTALTSQGMGEGVRVEPVSEDGPSDDQLFGLENGGTPGSHVLVTDEGNPLGLSEGGGEGDPIVTLDEGGGDGNDGGGGEGGDGGGCESWEDGGGGGGEDGGDYGGEGDYGGGGGEGDYGGMDADGSGGAGYDTASGETADGAGEVLLERVPEDLIDGEEYHIVPERCTSLRLKAPLDQVVAFADPTGETAERFFLSRTEDDPELWIVSATADARRALNMNARDGTALDLGLPDRPGRPFRLERLPVDENAVTANDARARYLLQLPMHTDDVEPTPNADDVADSDSQGRDATPPPTPGDPEADSAPAAAPVADAAPAGDPDAAPAAPSAPAQSTGAPRQVLAGDAPVAGGAPTIGDAVPNDAFLLQPCPPADTGDDDALPSDQLVDGAVYELYPRTYPDQRWSVAPPQELGSSVEVADRTGDLPQKFRARKRPDGQWNFVPLSPADAGDGREPCGLAWQDPGMIGVQELNDDDDAQAFGLREAPVRRPGEPYQAALLAPPGDGDEIEVTEPLRELAPEDLGRVAEPPKGTLRVPVVDTKNRTPVPAARVKIDDSFSTTEAITDDDGIATFPDVPLWPYVATLRRDWFETANDVYVPVVITDPTATEFNADACTMIPNSVVVQGRVVSSLAGRPAIAGASVTLSDSNPRQGFPGHTSCTTQQDGSFREVLYPGFYNMQVDAPECAPYAQDVEVKPCHELRGSTTRLADVMMNVNTYRCAGTVVQAGGGHALENAQVQFASPLSQTIAVCTSADGKFQLDAAPPNSTITVTARRQTPMTVDMPQDATAREGMLIKLEGVPCVVSGVVRDGTTSTVRGIAGASVQCGDIIVTSDRNGNYSITLQQGGQRTIEFTGGGCYPANYTLQLLDNVRQDAFLCPRLSGSQAFRFILRWNAHPRDLDMHMRAASGRDTIFWRSKTLPGIGAGLDCDVTNGYGPETITVTDNHQHLMLSIHNYTGSPGWDAADACVDVYTQDGHQQTIRCDTSTGPASCPFWYVCDTQNGSIVVKNTLVGGPP